MTGKRSECLPRSSFPAPPLCRDRHQCIRALSVFRSDSGRTTWSHNHETRNTKGDYSITPSPSQETGSGLNEETHPGRQCETQSQRSEALAAGPARPRRSGTGRERRHEGSESLPAERELNCPSQLSGLFHGAVATIAIVATGPNNAKYGVATASLFAGSTKPPTGPTGVERSTLAV